jgi:signal peptidase I
MKLVSKSTLHKWWLEWRMFLLFVLLLFSFRSSIADWSHVPTGSMKPTLLEGDRILVDKLAYDLRFPFLHYRLSTWDDPKRGDIVIFPSPETEELYVKRVIGIPGDTIEMKHNQVILNGKALEYRADNGDLTGLLNEDDRANFLVAEEKLDGKHHPIMVLNLYGQSTFASTHSQQKVPDGYYWVMGDNRDSSKDSRFIGMIERERIRGKATKVIISLDSENYWLPREGRYIQDLK